MGIYYCFLNSKDETIPLQRVYDLAIEYDKSRGGNGDEETNETLMDSIGMTGKSLAQLRTVFNTPNKRSGKICVAGLSLLDYLVEKVDFAGCESWR